MPGNCTQILQEPSSGSSSPGNRALPAGQAPNRSRYNALGGGGTARATKRSYKNASSAENCIGNRVYDVLGVKFSSV